MKQFTCLRNRSSVAIILLVTLTFCSPKKESEQTQNSQEADVTLNDSLFERSQIDEQLSTQDSLYLEILSKYPNAVDSDTIRWLYTFAIQELLNKSEDILFFRDGRIFDVQQFKGEHIMTIDGRFFTGRIVIRSETWPEFVKNIGSNRIRSRGDFVIEVKSIIPVHFETIAKIDDIPPLDNGSISGLDLSTYVHLSFEQKNSRPYYIVTGELIEFFLR